MILFYGAESARKHCQIRHLLMNFIMITVQQQYGRLTKINDNQTGSYGLPGNIMAIHSAAVRDPSCAVSRTALVFEAAIIFIDVFVFLCNVVLFLGVLVVLVVVVFVLLILRLCASAVKETKVFGIWRCQRSAIFIIGTLGEALIYFLLGFNLTTNLAACRAALFLLLFEAFACSAPVTVPVRSADVTSIAAFLGFTFGITRSLTAATNLFVAALWEAAARRGIGRTEAWGMDADGGQLSNGPVVLGRPARQVEGWSRRRTCC
mmetsp:Transcript_38928/g.85402  ORF Transcript_38928/g.85402 Transcript_38928/m.85402 type:complete len:263 (+) Transcript_38928:36-824(+)